MSYVTHVCHRVVSEKLTVAYLIKNFLAFPETRRLITGFRGIKHSTLTWARRTQPLPSQHIYYI